jgi:threonine/homoserine/homoserine lactone efflux protein
MAWESGLMLMLSVVPFALAMSLSPGPNNIMIAAIASRHGARRTLPYLLGTLVGMSALMLAAGFGLGELFVRWPSAHGSLKAVGVAYLLWLAWRVATAPASREITADKPFGFLTGMLFQWLNPKAWMMALGAISIFTTVGGAVHAETLLITLTCSVAFVPALVLWTIIGVTARRFLTSARTVAVFNASMGVLIALSAGAVLV